MVLFGFKSDKGKKRAVNEDAFFVLPKDKVFMVADGVGGHSSGEVASSMTVEFIANQVKAFSPDQIEDEEELKEYFLEILRRINSEVNRISKSNIANYGMATTLVMMYLRDDNAYIVNIGDSRAYLLRDGVLQQITDDHTYVNSLVKKGLLTKQQAALRNDKNMITRAIGAGSAIEPDFIQLDIFQNDRLLLCSDGLYDEVDDKTIESIMASGSGMRNITTGLVDKANENGGSDNITVIGVQI